MGEMKKRQREEAIRRLSILEDAGLHEDVRRQYEDEDTVFFSERSRLGKAVVGILYWIDNEERFAAAVHEVEDRSGCLVYHVTHEQTEFGELLTMLAVSAYPDEWERDREELTEGISYAYVKNLSASYCSEWGTVGFEVRGGGLVRTA